MPDNSKPELIVPYCPFKTFTSFIESLKQTAVSPRINRELMPKMSGDMQSRLLSALRFMGLTDSSGSTMEGLHKLVKASGTTEWRDTLSDVVLDAYSPIVGDMNLDTETGSALRAAFRDKGGAEGDTNDKAVRFYIKALEEIGITFSPHFKARRVGVKKRGTKKASTKKRSAKGKTHTQDEDHTDDYSGLQSFPLGGTDKIMLPKTLTLRHVDVIEKLIPALRAIAVDD